MRFRNTLILFTKTARICRVKTRMWPALSHRQCLFFHRKSTEHLYQSIAKDAAFNVCIYTTNNFKRVASLLPQNKKLQHGIDLGARMYHAMQAELKQAERVVIIGSDCIAMNTDYINRCFDRLITSNDLVLGQANDGGYVLIGAKKVSPQLFMNTDWGTANVLKQTSSNAQALGYNVHIMPELIDADSVEDLKAMAAQNNLPDWAKSLVINQ